MRGSGILMPIFSLPSDYGIGTFGKNAYEFVDFLNKSGQIYWQILPLNPTNYGNSPYQSFSSFAGNPYFIDLDMLIKDGLLKRTDVENVDFGNISSSIDYGKLYENREKILRVAFDNFESNEDFEFFCKNNNYWLENYAYFMTLKNISGGLTQTELKRIYKTDNDYKTVKAEYNDIFKFYKFIQFTFYKQWFNLKKYANEKGIKIIGDIPIYVAPDSADVFANSNLFMLDENGNPTLVAGCPPDEFTKNGQLWGNPIYNWDEMKVDGYKWWKERLKFSFTLYDIVRIDHFRGFESFYAIPFSEKTAENGSWIKGPDINFFKEIKSEFGENLPIIAEDLGFLTSEVENLLNYTGFPGMKILQFGFEEGNRSKYLPHNFIKNCVAYTGTHDNNTILGWYKTLNRRQKYFTKKYLNTSDENSINFDMIRAMLSSVADTVIINMADLLSLDENARLNTPSTLGNNWTFRVDKNYITKDLTDKLYSMTDIYGRTVR